MVIVHAGLALPLVLCLAIAMRMLRLTGIQTMRDKWLARGEKECLCLGNMQQCHLCPSEGILIHRSEDWLSQKQVSVDRNCPKHCHLCDISVKANVKRGVWDRRSLGGGSCGEPITKQTIKFLEAELGSEYSPSITRLKRRQVCERLLMLS